MHGDGIQCISDFVSILCRLSGYRQQYRLKSPRCCYCSMQARATVVAFCILALLVSQSLWLAGFHRVSTVNVYGVKQMIHVDSQDRAE